MQRAYRRYKIKNEWPQWLDNGVNSIGDWVDEQYKKLGNLVNVIKEALQKAFPQIYEKLLEFKKTIIGFFNSGIFEEILQFLKCIAGTAKAATAVKDTFKGFKDKYKALKVAAAAGPWGVAAAGAEMAIGFICNWEEFKKAVDFLRMAFKAKGDLVYRYVGQFIGKLLHAIGTSERRRRIKKLRRMRK